MTKILLIDDAEDVRLIVRISLHGSEYGLEEAEDAQSGLALLSQKAYDAILLDMQLPDRDGREIARELRSRAGWFKTVPIIALTGESEPEQIRSAVAAGCTQFLPKPVKKDRLLQVLGEVLKAAPTPPPTPIDPLILELIPQYLANRKKDLETAKAALAASDFPPIARMGHNMKGTAETYGLPVLGKLGAQLELRAKEADSAATKALLQEFESLLSQLGG